APASRRTATADNTAGLCNAPVQINAVSGRIETMPRFAANLSFMFLEVPFLDRFEAAAKAGFRAVEFLFPYENQPEEIASRLKANGLTQALFNLPPGDWTKGERGLAAIPG